MPLWVPTSRASYVFDNWGANPTATPGQTITMGTSNAEGTYAEVLMPTQETLGFLLRFANMHQSGIVCPALADVGVDPAGGSSYTTIISNICCGSAAPMIVAGSGQVYYFPIRIPANASVAVRLQTASSTGTAQVAIRAFGQPSDPHLFPVGQYSETLGTITNSNGVSFTPGNSADGTWVSLGTTARECWWWQLTYQIDNSAITAEAAYIELGVGDSTNKRIITRLFHIGTATDTCGNPMDAHLVWPSAYCRVPAGSEMWVRGRGVGTSDIGYNATAIGIGG
jgi:hypothetical protein